MRFREFFQHQEEINEIYDQILDPNNLPYVVGMAGAGLYALNNAGKWAYNKIIHEPRELMMMKRIMMDLMAAVKKWGPHDPRTQQHLEIAKEIPAVAQMAQEYIDYMKKQQPLKPKFRVIPREKTEQDTVKKPYLTQSAFRSGM
jgi:hypothetical protein